MSHGLAETLQLNELCTSETELDPVSLYLANHGVQPESMFLSFKPGVSRELEDTSASVLTVDVQAFGRQTKVPG